MIKEGKFGFLEAFALVTTLVITKIFYTSPLAIIKELGTSAWYGTLISCVVSLIFFGLLYLLMKRFPQQDLYQIFEAVLGKKVGKVFILVFAIYFLYYTGINLTEFTTILKVYSMPLTPPSIIIAAFLLVVAAMAYVGLEGIARVAYILFYLIITGLILILVLAFPTYDFDYLTPWFGYGLERTVRIGIFRASAYDVVTILAIFINSVHGLKNFKRVGIASLIFSGITFSFCLACSLAAFQYTVAGEHLSGMFQLSRIIYYTRFFQRIEAIFLFIWAFASVVTVSITFYIAISSYCRAFQISNHRPLLLPFAFLTFMITYLPSNIADLMEVHVKFIRQYSFVILYLMPVFVLILALILGKKGGKFNEKT